MSVSQYSASAAAALSAPDALYNSATPTLYQGPIPDSPETPIGTRAAPASFTSANSAFSVPAYTSNQELATAVFVSTSATLPTNGTACFARAIAASTTLPDYTVGAGSQPTTPVVVEHYVNNGGNAYVCVTGGVTGVSGGPRGVRTAIQDGSEAWNFNNAGGTDIVMGSSSVLMSVPLSATGLIHAIPAV